MIRRTYGDDVDRLLSGGLITGLDAAWAVPWGDDGGDAHIAPVSVERDTSSPITVGAEVRWSPPPSSGTGASTGAVRQGGTSQ